MSKHAEVSLAIVASLLVIGGISHLNAISSLERLFTNASSDPGFMLKCSSELAPTPSENFSCANAMPNVPGEWASSGEKAGAWIEMDFPQTVSIQNVRLHDRGNADETVVDGHFEAADGTRFPTSGGIAAVAHPTLPNARVHFDPPIQTTRLRFVVDAVGPKTTNVGLAEIAPDYTIAPHAGGGTSSTATPTPQPQTPTIGPSVSALVSVLQTITFLPGMIGLAQPDPDGAAALSPVAPSLPLPPAPSALRSFGIASASVSQCYWGGQVRSDGTPRLPNGDTRFLCNLGVWLVGSSGGYGGVQTSTTAAECPFGEFCWSVAPPCTQYRGWHLDATKHWQHSDASTDASCQANISTGASASTPASSASVSCAPAPTVSVEQEPATPAPCYWGGQVRSDGTPRLPNGDTRFLCSNSIWHVGSAGGYGGIQTSNRAQCPSREFCWDVVPTCTQYRSWHMDSTRHWKRADANTDTTCPAAPSSCEQSRSTGSSSASSASTSSGGSTASSDSSAQASSASTVVTPPLTIPQYCRIEEDRLSYSLKITGLSVDPQPAVAGAAAAIHLRVGNTGDIAQSATVVVQWEDASQGVAGPGFGQLIPSRDQKDFSLSHSFAQTLPLTSTGDVHFVVSDASGTTRSATLHCLFPVIPAATTATSSTTSSIDPSKPFPIAPGESASIGELFQSAKTVAASVVLIEHAVGDLGVQVWSAPGPDQKYTAVPSSAYNLHENTHGVAVVFSPPISAQFLKFKVTVDPKAKMPGTIGQFSHAILSGGPKQ